MSEVQTTVAKREIGWFPYVAAMFSFVPLIGVGIGCLSIIYGAIKRSWVLGLMGCLGILTTILLYGGLFYFGSKPTGRFGEVHVKMLSEVVLPDLVQAIEFYHLQNGKYPTELNQLNEKAAGTAALYSTPNDFITGGLGSIRYELGPNKKIYFLFAEGADKAAHTADDVFPQFKDAGASKLGYRQKGQAE